MVILAASRRYACPGLRNIGLCDPTTQLAEPQDFTLNISIYVALHYRSTIFVSLARTLRCMSDNRSATEQRARETSPTSAAAGAATKVNGNGRGTTVRALAGFRLPWPQGFAVNPTRLLWWGGLAVLAAIEIIQWLVGLMIGARSLVAGRMAPPGRGKNRCATLLG